MATRDILAFGLQAALPIIAAGVSYLLAQISRAAVRYIHSRTALVLLDTLTAHVEAAVADVNQRIVHDLKDPAKPGTWNEIAAKDAKEEALKLVRESAAGVIGDLKASDGLLGQLVEKAVSDIRNSDIRIRTSSVPVPPVGGTS